MKGLYRSDQERQADAALANITVAFRGVMRNGKMAVQETGPYERQILREERADAIARLAIDRAMRRAT